MSAAAWAMTVRLSVAEPVGVSEAWVTVEGTVEILDDGGLELACRLAKLYYEPEQAKRTIAAWTKAGNRVLLELTPTRIQGRVLRYWFQVATHSL